MRQASALFEAAGDRRSTCVCLVNLGAALGSVGLFDEAITVLERALKASEELELAVAGVPVRLNLSNARLSRGDAAEAARLAEEALRLLEGRGDVRLEGAARIWWARALAALDRGAEAVGQLERAIPTLDGVPGYLAIGLAVRASLSMSEGDTAAALDGSARALGILDELGAMQEGEGLVYLGRLDALRAAGALDEARALAARANRWLDGQRVGLNDELRDGLERIPEHAALRRILEELG
jgi:tetratricopeptide (TPR) repeat protein